MGLGLGPAPASSPARWCRGQPRRQYQLRDKVTFHPWTIQGWAFSQTKTQNRFNFWKWGERSKGPSIKLTINRSTNSAIKNWKVLWCIWTTCSQSGLSRSTSPWPWRARISWMNFRRRKNWWTVFGFTWIPRKTALFWSRSLLKCFWFSCLILIGTTISLVKCSPIRSRRCSSVRMWSWCRNKCLKAGMLFRRLRLPRRWLVVWIRWVPSINFLRKRNWLWSSLSNASRRSRDGVLGPRWRTIVRLRGRRRRMRGKTIKRLRGINPCPRFCRRTIGGTMGRRCKS